MDAPPALHSGTHQWLLMGRGESSTSVVAHRVQEEEEKEDVLGCIQQQDIHYRRGIFADSQRLICIRRIMQGAALQTALGRSAQHSKSCRTRLKGHRLSKPFPCAKGGEWEGAQETWINTRGAFGREEMKPWLPSFFPATFVTLASTNDRTGSSKKMPTGY